MKEKTKAAGEAKAKTTTSCTEEPMNEPPHSELQRELNCTEPFLYWLGVVCIPPLFIDYFGYGNLCLFVLPV